MAHNRRRLPDEPDLDERYETRATLDAEGNEREVRDPITQLVDAQGDPLAERDPSVG
ncbi:MAG: hypothetical protein IPN01_35375 [Deltaproteobacteria bacterium]|nr:hypothetical protein [Deltaproteobacteria bacterium]